MFSRTLRWEKGIALDTMFVGRDWREPGHGFRVNEISPSFGCSKPASMRSKVVFPHPEEPSSEKLRHGECRRKYIDGGNGPKRLVTLEIEMMLSVCGIVSNIPSVIGLNTQFPQ